MSSMIEEKGSNDMVSYKGGDYPWLKMFQNGPDTNAGEKWAKGSKGKTPTNLLQVSVRIRKEVHIQG